MVLSICRREHCHWSVFSADKSQAGQSLGRVDERVTGLTELPACMIISERLLSDDTVDPLTQQGNPARRAENLEAGEEDFGEAVP